MSAEEERLIHLLEGLRRLRTASILFIVSSLILGGSYLLLIPLVFSSLTYTSLSFSTNISSVNLCVAKVSLVSASSQPYPLMLLVISLSVMLLSVALSLVALFGFLIPSFSKLEEYDKSAFGTPATLVRVGYIAGFILLAVGFIFVLASVPFPGSYGLAMAVFLIIELVGFILRLIGYIGLAIGMFRLNDRLGEGTFLAAGILFIIGMFLPVLSFIGWILVLVGTGHAIDKLKSRISLAET